MRLLPEVTILLSPLKASISWILTVRNHDSAGDSEKSPWIPKYQHALMLHGPRQSYTETETHPTPSIRVDRELLVKNAVIALNPIDWKAP